MKNQTDLIGEIIQIPFMVGVIAIFLSPCIIAYQSYKWLVTGDWLPLSLSNVIDAFQIPSPAFKWLGLQKITNWLLAAPVTGCLFLGGAGMIFLGLILVDYRDKKSPNHPLRRQNSN